MITAWLLAYFATGAFVGFLAGLLGIGGGMTLVPVLAAMFTAQHFAPDHTVHLALGTGMASIVFTSSASVRSHHRLGGVDWSLVRRMGPGMVAGTLFSTALSGWIPQRVLALAFSVIVLAGATQILLGRKPSAGREPPGTPALVLIGTGIGVVCGLVSAGGAFMTVPFMLFCGVAMTTAIGTTQIRHRSPSARPTRIAAPIHPENGSTPSSPVTAAANRIASKTAGAEPSLVEGITAAAASSAAKTTAD